MELEKRYKRQKAIISIINEIDRKIENKQSKTTLMRVLSFLIVLAIFIIIAAIRNQSK